MPDSVFCKGCGQPIEDKYILSAIFGFWHNNCLKCVCCGVKLSEIGASLYLKNSLVLCQRDYARIFGLPGTCFKCHQRIDPLDWMMRVETSSSGGGQPNNSSKKYYFHLQCFGCEICGHRFCVGDPFFFDNEKIICEDEKSLHGDELYLQRISPKIFRMNDGKSE